MSLKTNRQTSSSYNPAMVVVARESRGVTQAALAKDTNLKQGTISKLESGDLVASEEAINKIAHRLGYPTSFFSQTDPVYPFGSSTFYHRRLQSVPASILRRIEARANIHRFHAHRLLRATDLDKRCRFHRIDAEDYGGRIEEIAQLVRSEWRVPAGPINDLIRLIEDSGAIVIRFNFGTPKMFGLSEWIPPYAPMFFLNDNREISADRDRFTLAHELGHVFLHALPDPDMEDEANRFAAEFLMPERDIRAHLSWPIKLHTVARLKPFWKVSMAALIDRSRSLGIINQNQYVYLRIQLQRKGYRLREPAELDIPREQPSLLKEVIRAHVGQLGYGHSDLARMVNMEPQEFKDYYGLNDQYRGLTIVR